ncbi:MAG TPA: hypothetical protein VK737_08980 [Opitutales bacterium]|jgi:hypothetical protein|nr:hypothetical protein [Opitutales bacterium]
MTDSIQPPGEPRTLSSALSGDAALKPLAEPASVGENPEWAASPYRMVGSVGVNLFFSMAVCWLVMGVAMLLCAWVSYLIVSDPHPSKFILGTPVLEWQFFAKTLLWGPLAVVWFTCFSATYGIFSSLLIVFSFVFATCSDTFGVLLKRCAIAALLVVLNVVYLQVFVYR